MPQGKWFNIAYGSILVLLIVFLGSKVPFIFKPFVVLVQTIFAPVLISGVLYYLFRPFVQLMAKKMPRILAILIIYLGMGTLFTLLVMLIGPELQTQFKTLSKNIPSLINEFNQWFVQIQHTEIVGRFLEGTNISLEELFDRFGEYATGVASMVGASISNVIGIVTNIVLVVVIIPFILFYMLKDGDKFPKQVLLFIPSKEEKEGRKILSEMDNALSSYIQGQIIVSLCVGVLCYIGFLIIGLDYSLVLALIALFTNFIPFLGPWIGTIPAAIVGFIESPLMGILVIVVILIVQQVESNLISPFVMGKKLDVHPLTIILLILAAGRFAGILGMILAVPTYAVCKVIIINFTRLWKLRKTSIDQSPKIKV